MDEKLEIKLHKLLALARRGEGGERVNAQRFLGALLKKHNLTLSDIADEHIATRWFKYKGKIELNLLRQIIVCVTNSRVINFWKSREKRETLGVDVSKSEMLEIELMFNSYSKSLKEDIGILFSAFIHRNDIFPRGKEGEEIAEVSQEEEARIRKIANMMKSVSKVEIRKQIGGS